MEFTENISTGVKCPFWDVQKYKLLVSERFHSKHSYKKVGKHPTLLQPYAQM